MKIRMVSDSSAGEHIVKDFLYENSDSQTVLFLSGGKTPKSLYEQLLAENKLKYGAVAMTDERYGEVGHENSNALIMKAVPAGRQGFNPFCPILNGESLEDTALQYDQTVRDLFARFNKSIGALGIGSDGHTAGIPAIPKIAEEIIEDKTSFVKSYDQSLYHALMHDTPVSYGKRITMTFNAIEKLDQILIMAFGKDKKEALRKMFEKGPEWEIPARFFLRPEISKKTTLVTDQEV